MKMSWIVVPMLVLACGEVAPEPSPPAEPEPKEEREVMTAGPFVEILGVAQDAGVPQAACASANCDAARRDPSLRRYATSLVLVSESGDTYLFEATPDIRPQLDRILELGRTHGRPDRGRRWLDGIFLTHAHMGHYTGLLHLGFEAAHSQDVSLFATEKMVAFLSDNQPWRQLIDLGNVVPRAVMPGGGARLEDGVEVLAFHVPHRDELSDTVAWRIVGPNRTILFMPDCDPWGRWSEKGFDLEQMLQGVDVFLVDATFYSGDELPGRDLSKIGHPLVVDSLERFARDVASGELEVIFIHFNHSNPLLTAGSAESAVVRDAGFKIAHRGLQLPL